MFFKVHEFIPDYQANNKPASSKNERTKHVLTDKNTNLFDWRL